MRLLAYCVVAGVAAVIRLDYRRFKRELAISLGFDGARRHDSTALKTWAPR